MPLINHSDVAKLVKETDARVQHWTASSEFNVEWNGRIVKGLDAVTLEKLEELCKISSIGSAEFHEEARDLVLAIDLFAAELEKFSEALRDGSNSVDPSGSSEMQSAYHQMLKKVEKFRPNPIEPVQLLIERDRVPAWQVCKIYGWGSEARGWDTHKVQEEIASPGIHTDEKSGWVNPMVLAHKKDVDERWKRRSPIVAFASGSERFTPMQEPEAPESLETLIVQKLPIEQIMRMKKVTREKVEQEASRLGISLIGARFVSHVDPLDRAEERMALEEKHEREYAAEQAKKLKTKASRLVKALVKEGKSNEEIAATMASEFPSLDVSSLLPEQTVKA